MKKFIALLFFIISSVSLFSQGKSYIRVNYVGYLPKSVKVAVYIKEKQNEAGATFSIKPSAQAAWIKAPKTYEVTNNSSMSKSKNVTDKIFVIKDAITDEILYTNTATKGDPNKWGLEEAFRLDFSDFEIEGGYYIEFLGTKSPLIKIGADVYDGAADILLYYMRQQQCGYNPFVDTLCHQHDGYIVDHPYKNGEKIDVRGGWHDASDFLQYQTTSATATFQMMFAYKYIKDKSVFKDKYDKDGKLGSNGVPDILDQAKWGLDWLLKMNPDNKVMYNQIADDRDHIGFKPPQFDKADYGWGEGKGRPVYFLTGEPQGFGKFGKNRTTGVASTAGKFASSFALGAEIFKKNRRFYNLLNKKAIEAYNFAKEFPGNTQTACYVSRYFYEEDTWVDDVELAAASIFSSLSNPDMIAEADYYGELEPVTPWMELGRGRHYQYYPFINLGHYIIASEGDTKLREKYTLFMKEGLQYIRERAGDDPFMNGIPYIWCSNNLTSAAVTQAQLYRSLTGDKSFEAMEAALRDWLLGCNPWGTSMIIGYPKGGVLPTEPHSVFTELNREVTGGLIDGPVYNFIFSSRAGSGMRKPDAMPYLNKGIAVYHNDLGDYATNEPTMDGTASLTYYFASLEQEGNIQKGEGEKWKNVYEKDDSGAIRRLNRDKKEIYLIFSADSLFNGGEKILNTLNEEGIKASFFLTGNALRMEQHSALIDRIIADSNYVGGHSDRHLLYAPWGKDKDSLLVTEDSLISDLRANAAELLKKGVDKNSSRWFLPPYEHYNQTVVNLIERGGYKVINYTNGTATPADYTIPSMTSYTTANEIIKRLYNYEKNNGLNGAILLIHPGIEESRPEKERLYNKLKEIIVYLKNKGYTFKSFNDVDD